jgi:(2Fe-2S) ferredoxin
MSRFERHIFVCVNERPPGHPKGCCKEKGSETVRALLKAELKKLGLTSVVRANASGCLDACAHGVSMVIYPEGIWYGGVTPQDVPAIIEQTILNGKVIDRLLIPDPAFAPDHKQFPILPLPQGKDNSSPV